MSGANASPLGRSHQEMAGANASPLGRSHQEMAGANASPLGRSHQEMKMPSLYAAIAVGIFSATVFASMVFAQQQTAPATPAWSRTTAARQTTGTPAERGAAVFNNWCSACHSRDTRNAAGTRSLQFKYEGRLPAALEDRRDLTAKTIELAVRQGAPYMSIFRKTEISDADLQALTAYLTQSKQ